MQQAQHAGSTGCIRRVCSLLAHKLQAGSDTSVFAAAPLSGRFVRWDLLCKFAVSRQLRWRINYRTHDSFKQPNEELYTQLQHTSGARAELQSGCLVGPPREIDNYYYLRIEIAAHVKNSPVRA